MAEKFDVVAIGDIGLDTFIEPSETESICKLDSHECMVCFTYGEKIPVSDLSFSLGGNAGNHAVGVSRLGLKSALISSIGDDIVGEEIKSGLSKEGVNIENVSVTPKGRSNHSTVVRYGGERTIFTYHAPHEYMFKGVLPDTEWVYLTSMGENFEEYYKNLAAYLGSNSHIKLAFNPGTRQIKAGVDLMKEVLSKTYILYVNREEAARIVNMDPHQSEKDLLMALSNMGPKISVITDGENGSFAYDKSEFYGCTVMPISAYERTGAGDAFGSGSVGALVRGMSLPDALLWGTVNSASVIGYIGAEAGLLNDTKMREWLDRAKSSGVAPRKI